MSETVRTYLYWIDSKTNSNPAVIHDNIHEMTSHTDATLMGPPGAAPKLGKDFTLKGIFLSKIKEDRMSAMVYDGEFYLLIDNHLMGEEIKSNIWFQTSPIDLVALLPKDLVKYLDLKPGNKILDHLSKKDKELLSSSVPLALDFIFTPEDQHVDLFKRWVASLESVMDLSKMWSLTPRSLSEFSGKIETLILNHNNNMLESGGDGGAFSWLSYFPNLKVLTVYHTAVTDDSLNNLHKYAPKLTIVEFHYCSALTGRALISLSLLPSIDKIVIDNERCSLQETTYETVISDKEWDLIKATCSSTASLTTLFINSANLTLDFIDFCLKSFPGLTNFIMHEMVLQKLEKHSRSGHSERRISFHSASNISTGFYRYADVKITDLVRNKIGPAFSESMMRKIRELDPSKADILDSLVL